MALFKKKDKSVLPEVDQYYQGEQRDRTWLAWILAAISVAVVVLILIGFFFIGKWAFNAITGDDSDDVAVTTDNDSENLPSFDGDSDEDQKSNNDSSGDQDTGSSSVDSGAGADSDQASDGTVDAPAQTTIPSGQTPSTGANSEDLPGTGPGGLAATFLVTSGLAGTTHYIVSRKNKK